VAELPTAPLSPTERDVIRLAATGQDIDRTFPQNCIGSGCHRHWFVIALLAPVEHAPLPARIVPLCISCSAAYPIARIQFSIFSVPRWSAAPPWIQTSPAKSRRTSTPPSSSPPLGRRSLDRSPVAVAYARTLRRPHSGCDSLQGFGWLGVNNAAV
jgi:hypothetical protein